PHTRDSLLPHFRRPPASALVPYTTLFRSGIELDRVGAPDHVVRRHGELRHLDAPVQRDPQDVARDGVEQQDADHEEYGVHGQAADRKSTRLNSSHVKSSYAVFCLTKKTRP